MSHNCSVTLNELSVSLSVPSLFVRHWRIGDKVWRRSFCTARSWQGTLVKLDRALASDVLLWIRGSHGVPCPWKWFDHWSIEVQRVPLPLCLELVLKAKKRFKIRSLNPKDQTDRGNTIERHKKNNVDIYIYTYVMKIQNETEASDIR